MKDQLKKLQEYLNQEGLTGEANLLDFFILKIAQEIYVVKPGDILSEIAGGDPLYQKLIESANPGLKPDSLKIGQKINLPTKPIRPNEAMTYSPSLVTFVKQYEGMPSANNPGKPYLVPYDDKFGNITIGWGHNLGSVNINNVSPISLSQAENLLRADLDVASEFIARNVNSKLSQFQFDAITSLTFNAGVAKVFKTRLFEAVNRGDFRTASMLFPTTLVGENQGGLQIRRNKEAAMFNGGVGVY